MLPRKPYTVPIAGGRSLDLGARTLVMAVVNITPDSFAESPASTDPALALDRALEAEAQGADLLDLGAESTRPGAGEVPATEELARLLPALRAIAARVRIPISVDTRKAAVAHAALGEGAAIVNDISGLRYDAALGGVVAAAGAGLVVMHMRGTPGDMYAEASYTDVAADVARELAESLARAEAAGIDRASVIVDPGIGFAKKAAHSYEALARLDALGVLDRPILVGTSRKSFLQAATGERPPAARDWGTAASVAAAILGGAHIVRVHAVPEMVQVVRVADEIRKHRGPGGARRHS
jgi:dihydropteroate synthase